jgi:hypothetical protein
MDGSNCTTCCGTTDTQQALCKSLSQTAQTTYQGTQMHGRRTNSVDAVENATTHLQEGVCIEPVAHAQRSQHSHDSPGTAHQQLRLLERHGQQTQDSGTHP